MPSRLPRYGTPTNNAPSVGSFSYRNDRPSTTLWYHDHSLGITRLNVYAGPAGFWLIREPNSGETGLNPGVNTLPAPAPAPGETLATTNFPASLGGARGKYREIPIAIQARSFNTDGSLFYPADRAFFEGISTNRLHIPLIGDSKYPSDIPPIWNPEAFFNVIVVNGTSWPSLDVAQALYRFRLLNGCNSRFLNLSMFVVNTDGTLGAEVPFYQIGAEQGLLPNVVKVETGKKTTFCKNTTAPCTAAGTEVVTTFEDGQQALLMGLAERADVIVDFRGLADGTKVRMINTAPDAPFGGFPDIPADPATSGQVMEFVVDTGLNGKSPTDPGRATPATAPQALVLSLPDPTDPASGGTQATVRDLARLEEASTLVCASVSPSGTVTYAPNAVPGSPAEPEVCLDKHGKVAKSLPFAPKAAVLGTNGSAGGNVTLWSSPIATNPAVGATETWELWNWTEDGHPIHLHLVKFKVLNREAFDPDTGQLSGAVRPPAATEAGWKDTVIAYPGEVTRLNATFDIAGLYVWHCHIVEHEDNEMMVPYCVGSKSTAPGCGVVP
jgi:spore coat protein A